MADLAGKTTSGENAWDKYILRNKNWRNLELQAEIDSALYRRKGVNLENILEFKKGTPIKLKRNTTTIIAGKKYAEVQIQRKDGYVSLTSIRKPTNFSPTGYEEEVVSIINSVIRKNGNIPIDIVIPGIKTYKGILGAIQVDLNIKRLGGVVADPKADIILYTEKRNYLSTNNIFISHKKEGGPEAFQQYGGLTKKAGIKIYNHPETRKFLKVVAKNIDKNGLKNPMYMIIKDSDLKNMSIFGPEYGVNYGLDHVQLIGQGLPQLIPTKKENVWKLNFSSHMSISGDLTHFIGGYTPVFGATYREGRGFEVDGKQYSGARVGIYPQKLIVTRTDVEKIKN